MQLSVQNRHWLVIAVVGIVAFCTSNSYVVPDIMESRNLITAHEMIEQGHWVVPTMNDEIRLEKPPLPTWIAALTMLIAGDDWNALRLVPGLMGLLALIYVYKLAKRMTGSDDYALTSALILATCYNFVLASRTVTWDIYCHAFMIASIYYQYMLFAERRHQWRHATLAGIGLGLSIMSKGPVSLYALWLPFIIASALTRITTRREQRSPLGRDMVLKVVCFLVVGIVVGGAWYAYIWLQEAQTGAAVLNKESGSWLNHNVRPWYYYSTFFTETGIWLPVCVLSLAVPYWARRVFDGKNYMYMFAWMVASLVLLSCLPEKKNRYLLPLLIPASLTMAYLVVYWGKVGRRILWGVVGLFAFLELVGMPMLAKYFSNTEYTRPKEMITERYPTLPVYYSARDTVRIELTYDAGRSVHPIDFDDSAAVAKAKPFLIITTAESRYPDAPLALGARKIGSYDANRQSRLLKKDRPMFYYNLYVYE